MRECFGAETIGDYLLNYKDFQQEWFAQMDKIEAQKRQKHYTEQEIIEARESLFPPDNWGKFNPKKSGYRRNNESLSA